MFFIVVRTWEMLHDFAKTSFAHLFFFASPKTGKCCPVLFIISFAIWAFKFVIKLDGNGAYSARRSCRYAAFQVFFFCGTGNAAQNFQMFLPAYKEGGVAAQFCQGFLHTLHVSNWGFKQMRYCVKPSLVHTLLTTATSDRNLQFWGSVSAGCFGIFSS